MCGYATTEVNMTQATGKTSAAPKKAAAKKAKASETELGTAAEVEAGTKTARKTAARKTAAKAAGTDEAKAAKKPRASKAAGGTGRRPGRPAKSANNDVGAFDDDMDIEPEVIPDFKPMNKRGKRGKGDKESGGGRNQLTQEEQEARRNRLKVLIKLGKDRGYLTYGEINDHLPDDLVDAEAIDGIISTFSDMGISVYDQAPDAEALLLSDSTPVAASDDDVEDEAEAALTTVDSDFGRTTDPVRMYMREMGSVELLTREGEIEIAKRIEDGL